MNIKSNTDINNLKFLNDNTSISMTLSYLQNLKKKSSVKIDLDCFNLIVDEINNKKLNFKITPQEQNYLSKISDDKALEYLIYRYKFKEYPKKKISTDYPIYILIAVGVLLLLFFVYSVLSSDAVA